MVGSSARKVQYLDMDLSKSSFSLCANICLCVSNALSVKIFRCGGFNSTFSSWCSIREWLRPELCCRISTLCSQWHLVSLWKHYQRNQVTMCLWEILNWTWLVCLLQPDTITKISVVARSCHTKPSFCQRLETASRVLVQELVSPSWQYSIGAHRWWVKPFIGGIQAQAFKSLVTQKCMFNGWLWLTAC